MIRTFKARDYEQVLNLHLEGLRDTGALPPQELPEWDADLRDIEGVYLSEGSCFWVVEEHGRVIGMTAVRRVGPETAELKRMRVTSHRRRSGVGQRLLDIAEEFCRRHGYKEIVLETTDRQEVAQSLYERNGFMLTDQRHLEQLLVYCYRKELE